MARADRERPPDEFSAGGVVVRRFAGRPFICVVEPRIGVLALPKGHVEPGETPIEAAVREVREETGLTVEPICELGETRYWYTRGGRRVFKRVLFFLCRYRAGALRDYDREEVLGASWIPLSEAPERLSYRGERKIAAKAQAIVAERSAPAADER